MKKTLLEMVQDILAAMEADEVNAIADTAEAEMVARIIKDSYYEIISSANLPETFSLFQLDPSGDPDLPVVMYLPDTYHNLHWIKYNSKEALADPELYKDLQYLDLESFLQRMYALDTTEDNVGTLQLTLETGDLDIFYTDDKHPQYYTTFNDRTILFDSYFSDLDTTLQQDKTVCWGEEIQTFTLSDSFIPNLDAKQFQLLMNEAKSQAFVELKQTENPKAEQRARRGWVRSQREKITTPFYQNAKRKTNTNFGR